MASAISWCFVHVSLCCGHNFVNAEGQAVIVGGGSLRYLMEGFSDEIHSSSFSSVKPLGFLLVVSAIQLFSRLVSIL